MICTAGGAALGFIFLPVLMPDAGVSPYVGMAGGLAVGFLVGFAMYRVTTAATFGGILAAGFALMTAAGFHLASNGTRLVAAANVQFDQPPLYPDPTGSGQGGDRQPTYVPPERDAPPLIDPDVPDPGPAPKRPGEKPAIKAPTPAKNPAPKPAGGKPVDNPSPNGPAGKPVPASPGGDLIRDPLSIGSARDAVNIGNVAELSATARQAREFWNSLSTDARSSWDRTPGAERLWIITAGLVGLGLGIALGIVMPNWAAATVTAFAGAAIFLPALVWLAHALSVPGREILNLSALGWAMVWVAVALIGVAIQTQGLIPIAAGAGEGDAEPKAKKKTAGKRKKKA